MIYHTVFIILVINAFVQSYTSISELEDSNYETTTEYEITNGRIHMTLKQYYCAWNDSSDSKLLTVGSKSWVFPKQDVNLVLTYPDNNETIRNDVITKFNVFIKMDGNYSRGYITSGGILQDHITLSFVFRGITNLSYQFRLWGMSSEYFTGADTYTHIHEMC